MKLIVSDVDGTLIRPREQKPDKTVSLAINRVTDSGSLFSFATGRSMVEVKKLFDTSDKALIICCDGALCMYRGRVIYEKSFSSLSEFDWFSSVVLYGKYMMYIKGTDAFVRQCKKQYYAHAVSFCDTSEIKEPIYKALIHKKGEKIELEGMNKIYDSFSMTEFVPCGVDKCSSLVKIIEANGWDKKDCVVFGDSENDRSMLSEFENSYAMIWAKPSIKASASYITDSVVKTIEKNFIGGTY